MKSELEFRVERDAWEMAKKLFGLPLSSVLESLNNFIGSLWMVWTIEERNHHKAVVELVFQIGFPHLTATLTLSPFEN